MEDTHIFYNDRPLLKRSWILESTSNKASLKLFFTEEELMALIEKAGYTDIAQALPSRMSIVKLDGGDMRPDNYELAQSQTNVKLNKFYDQDEVWYVEVPNILFEEGKPTSLFLEMTPTILSSTDPSPVIELDTDLDFYVYSNPVIDEVRLGEDHATHLGTGIITIYNKLGQELHQEEFFKETLHGKAFNVADYTPGLYLIVVRYKDRDFTQTLKFIKV